MTAAIFCQMSAKTAFLTLLWAFTLFVATECCWGATAPIIGKMPPDQDTEVGSDVSLNCTLLSDEIQLGENTYRVNSSMIAFKFNLRYLPAESVDILDAYTATLKLKNASTDQSGLYYCFVKVPGVRNVTVCVSSVNIGYSPQPITTFDCRSMHFENLTCYWTPQLNKIMTNYTLQDVVGYEGNYNGFVRQCPAKISSTSCQWRMDTSPPYRQNAKFFNMRLIGNNSLGEYVQNIRIDHYKIVLPGAPEDFIQKEQGTTFVVLQWKPPKHMEYFPPGLIYQIHYGLSSRPGKDYAILNLTKNAMEYNLTGLVPYTIYRIKIHCISSVADSPTMWSEFTTTGVMTLPDEPYVAPEASSQGFEVHNYEGNRSVRIYWKMIPPELYNGENFRYVVSYFPTFVKRPKRVSATTFLTTNYFFLLENLDSYTAYHFTIRSTNSMGTSKNYSTMIIDKMDNMPSTPEDITAISLKDGIYELSWKPPSTSSSPVVNYTVFWCQNVKPRPYQCEGLLEWKHVLGTNVTLSLPNNSINYQFAVAANTNYSSSGMEWASCMVPYDGVLGKIEHVSLEKINSTALKVNWQLGCNAQKAVVTEYQIFSCVNNNSTCHNNGCSGTQQVELVRNPQLTSYVLTKLQPFMNYGVKIRALTAKGRSEDSDLQCESTLSGAPADPPNDVTISDVTNSSAVIHWKPPSHPNGEITKYTMRYNRHTVDASSLARLYAATDLRPYTNYSFQVSACVNKDCSNFSEPDYQMTSIGVPTKMEQPQTDNVNSTYMVVFWKPPPFPNGPIDVYVISIYISDGDNETLQNNIVVPGNRNSTLVAPDCSSLSDGKYILLRIQAGNKAGNDTLLGPPSTPTQARFCITEKTLALPMILGFSIGGTLGLAALVFVLYFLVSWMKRKVDLMKDVKVQLPKGLDSPYSNPLNSYENFMNGLIRRSSTNLSPKLGPPPPPTPAAFTEEDDGFKNRHGSGNSQFSASSTDELLQKKGSRNQKLGRNPSGESSGCSSGGHDSISSSGTNHTTVSSDSGTEVDIASATFDRKCEDGKVVSKPDADCEKAGRGCLDSRMQHSENSPATKCYVTPYSLFGTEKMPLPHYSRALSLYGHNLANSEPSVANLGTGRDEPYTGVKFNDGNWQMYSKFGLSNSTADVRDPYCSINPESETEGIPPYSRFGVCSKPPAGKLPYVTVGMALMLNDKEPPPIPQWKKAFEMPPSATTAKAKPLDAKKGEAQPAQHGGCYSMFGIQEKGPEEAPLPMTVPSSSSKGYVSFQDAQVKLNHPVHSDSFPEDEGVVDDEGFLPEDLLNTLTLPEITNSCENVAETDLAEEGADEPTDSAFKAPTKNGYVSHDFLSKITQERDSPPSLPDVVCCAGTEWRTGSESSRLPKDILGGKLINLKLGNAEHGTNDCGLVYSEV